MYKSGQIIDIYGDGFREFDDRPPTTKAAWGLNIFWSKDNPSISDDFTLKLIVTPYRGTNDQRFFKNTHDEQIHFCKRQ